MADKLDIYEYVDLYGSAEGFEKYLETAVADYKARMEKRAALDYVRKGWPKGKPRKHVKDASKEQASVQRKEALRKQIQALLNKSKGAT